LKLAPESRLKSDLTEILHHIRHVKFFQDHGIKDNDLMEVCENIKYEFHEKGSEVLSFGQRHNEMYIVLDG
jgi:hypothetical protein